VRVDGGRSRLALAGFLALSFSAGIVGAVASADAREFYAALVRPAWAPPGWLFGPVWSTLYFMMGVSAWLVWRERPATVGGATGRQWGLRLFVFQLLLNALWTWVFFGWRHGAVAFAEIVLLWFAILLTLRQFARVQPLSAWLLVPYLAWVSFAVLLTWAVWQANPGQL
jgi:tryptophan-rich sensory protein